MCLECQYHQRHMWKEACSRNTPQHDTELMNYVMAMGEHIHDDAHLSLGILMGIDGRIIVLNIGSKFMHVRGAALRMQTRKDDEGRQLQKQK